MQGPSKHPLILALMDSSKVCVLISKGPKTGSHKKGHEQTRARWRAKHGVSIVSSPTAIME